MLFNPEINSIEEDILYHETQIKEAQERLDQVQVSQAYSDTVISSLEDFFENTDPFMFEILKGHIDQMFADNKVTYNNDFEKKEPSSLPPTVEEIKLPVTLSQPKKEFGPLSYYELTGKPDTRPDTYEDLAPNITYSSSGRAYVGFNDKQEAEEFSNRISEPFMIGDTDTMNGYKYEVKFYCTREYIEELLHKLHNDDFVQDEDWTEGQKAELDWQEQLQRIAPDIFYDPSQSKCYVGFSAKGRCDSYGSYLTRILDIAEKYIVSSKPTVTTNTKYELVLEQIELESAKHLSKFNLKKEYDDSKNKDARELWRTTRKRVHPPACKPSPKLTPLEEIKLGDIVYLNSIDNQYKVLSKVELEGTPHIKVINIYNSERPSLVSAISYLKECYLVPAESIQVDSALSQEEEILTENVQIYVPKEETVKKSKVLSEKDFSPCPYPEMPLTEVEFGDVITSTPHSRSAYMVKEHKGEFVMAECLYHKSLPARIGEEYSFSKIYLVEKASPATKESASTETERREENTGATVMV